MPSSRSSRAVVAVRCQAPSSGSDQAVKVNVKAVALVAGAMLATKAFVVPEAAMAARSGGRASMSGFAARRAAGPGSFGARSAPSRCGLERGGLLGSAIGTRLRSRVARCCGDRCARCVRCRCVCVRSLVHKTHKHPPPINNVNSRLGARSQPSVVHHHTTVVASPFGFSPFGFSPFGFYRPMVFSPFGGLLSMMFMMLAASLVFSFVRVGVLLSSGLVFLVVGVFLSERGGRRGALCRKRTIMITPAPTLPSLPPSVKNTRKHRAR